MATPSMTSAAAKSSACRTWSGCCSSSRSASAFVFQFTTWGRHLYAIGGNEQAARLTGVPVDRIKLQAYIVCALTAAIASIMVVGWQGSAINALGTGYELRVIASTVIGGANLLGGEGGAFGAFIGAALIEVIRNSLLMAGVDSQLAGDVRRRVHHFRGSARADPRKSLGTEHACPVRASINREVTDA